MTKGFVRHMRWYSICSAHRERNPTCPRCKKGMWVDEVEAEKSRQLFKEDPDEWRRQHNANEA